MWWFESGRSFEGRGFKGFVCFAVDLRCHGEDEWGHAGDDSEQ